MKQKNRFSIPGRIYDLLFSDDKYFQEILKIRKVEESFPKYDQWVDNYGFNICYALAGYSADDINISVKFRQLIVNADGMAPMIHKKEAYDAEEALLLVDSEEEDKVKSTSVHTGFISRGIARRSFKSSLYISEEFDISKVQAKMKDGLLTVSIPHSVVGESKIKINKE